MPRSWAVVSVVGILVALAVLGGLGAFIYWLLRREKRHQRTSGQLIDTFTAAMDRLGERELDETGKANSMRWVIDRGNRRWRAGIQPGSRSPPSFWIRGDFVLSEAAAPTPFRGQGQPPLARPPRLVMRPETRRDRLGKALRLNRELQIGDPGFDEAVYLESDDSDELVGSIVGSARLRGAVIALLALGPDQVALCRFDEPIDVTWSGSHTGNPFLGDRLDRALDALDVFAEELPAFARAEPDGAWPRGAAILTATILAGILGGVLMVWGGNVYQPVSNDPVYGWWMRGLILTFSVTVLCWWRAKGGSKALRMVGWTAGLGLVAWPALLGGAVLVANGLFDGPTKERSVVVVSRYTTTAKNTTKHWLELRPWPPHERAKIRVDEDRYLSTAVGETRMRFGDGALGIEWYDGD